MRLASWFGLTFDLSNDLRDDWWYEFKSESGSIEEVSFRRSSLPADKVPDWLSGTRARAGGAYGVKVAAPENFANARASATGVRIQVGKEFLWSVYVLFDAGVVEIDAKCRSDCEPLVRSIVSSLRPLSSTDGGNPSPKTHSYRVLDLVFESSLTLVGPDSFALSNSEGLQLISCRRAPERPQPDALPEIGGEGADALRGASSVHEMVGNSTTFRFTHREVKGIDYLQEPQSFVAAGAVAPLASGGFLVCELNRYAKPEALPRFRRFLASARPE